MIRVLLPVVLFALTACRSSGVETDDVLTLALLACETQRDDDDRAICIAVAYGLPPGISDYWVERWPDADWAEVGNVEEVGCGFASGQSMVVWPDDAFREPSSAEWFADTINDCEPP